MKIKKLIPWIPYIIFFASIAVFSLFYIRWFQISPFSNPFYSCIIVLIIYIVYGVILAKFANSPNFINIWFPVVSSLVLTLILSAEIYDTYIGLFLLFSYIVYSLIRLLQKHHNLKNFYALATVMLFLANWHQVYDYMPDVYKTVTFNGATYYITWNDEPEHEDYVQLTKRRGVFDYETYVLMYKRSPEMKFLIDEKAKEVSVVIVYSNELSYTDSTPPRFYEEGSSVQSSNHRYYASSKYVKDISCYGGFTCQVLTYTLYECELDNTGCRLLPFEYTTGDGGGDSTLEVNEATNEINFYLGMGEYPFKKTLIYTYGSNPQCHIDGCVITNK